MTLCQQRECAGAQLKELWWRASALLMLNDGTVRYYRPCRSAIFLLLLSISDDGLCA